MEGRGLQHLVVVRGHHVGVGHAAAHGRLTQHLLACRVLLLAATTSLVGPRLGLPISAAPGGPLVGGGRDARARRVLEQHDLDGHVQVGPTACRKAVKQGE